MVLAVPMTAVMRIYLAAMDHPLPRYIAQLLSGQSTAPPKPVLRKLAIPHQSPSADSADPTEASAGAHASVTLASASAPPGSVPASVPVLAAAADAPPKATQPESQAAMLLRPVAWAWGLFGMADGSSSSALVAPSSPPVGASHAAAGNAQADHAAAEML